MPFMKKSQPEHTAPPAENLSQLRAEFRHQLWKTILLFFIGTVVIAAASVAWFVSNSRVNSATAPVSAGFETIKLATKGVRQAEEQKRLKLSEGEQLAEPLNEYYSVQNGIIALRLAKDQTTISPGASGSVTFYVIPARDGPASVTLYLGLTGYISDGTESAKRVDDHVDVLDSLLSGHILLFGKLSGGYYSQWLFQENDSGILNNSITVNIPKDTAAGTPIPVTVHWIWPLRYKNMQSDLYAENSSEYTERFQPFLSQQEQANSLLDIDITTSNYRYDRIFLTNETGETIQDCSKAYDLADEYIGTNAEYLYLTVQTSSTLIESGKEQP